MIKPTLLLLHGALGAKSQLIQLCEKLAHSFIVNSMDFEGHGGDKLPPQYSIQLFTDNLKEHLDKNEINDVYIFGYSMGGYVALNLARNDKRIKQIFTLGTKFHWTPESASHEIKMLNADKIEEKVPAFAQALAKRHAPQDWKEVMRKTADMMIELGNNPLLVKDTLREVTIPVTISWGTEDNMVTQEESEKTTFSLPKGDFHVFNGFKHPIEQVNLNELATTLEKAFLK